MATAFGSNSSTPSRVFASSGRATEAARGASRSVSDSVLCVGMSPESGTR